MGEQGRCCFIPFCCKRDIGMYFLLLYAIVGAPGSALAMTKYGFISVPWLIWLPSLVALFGICLSCALCIPQCYKNKGLKTCTWVILFVFITLLTNVLWLFLVLNKFDDLSPSEWYCDNQDGLVPGTAEHDACKAKDLKGDLIPAFFYLAFDLYLSFEMYFWMRDANKD